MRTCACGLGSPGSKPLSGVPAGRKRGHLRGVPRSILAEAHGCAPKPFRWKELLPLHHSLQTPAHLSSVLTPPPRTPFPNPDGAASSGLPSSPHLPPQGQHTRCSHCRTVLSLVLLWTAFLTLWVASETSPQQRVLRWPCTPQQGRFSS